MKSLKGFMLIVVLLSALVGLGAQTPEWEWVVQAGGINEDYGRGIAVDAAGNSYVTGYFQGTAAFGTTSLTSSGESDIFISKLDANGNYLWAKKAGGSGIDYGRGIAVDAAGNSYVTGYFQGTAAFGTTSLTSSGGYDIFICKMNANGSYIWAKKAGGSVADRGYGVAVDGDGNCYLTGYFQYTATFDTISLISSGSHDIFVCKLDSNGNFLWASQAGGPSSDMSYGIAVDNAGNTYVTGYFQGTATFGSTSLISSGGYDIFVCKLSSNGNYSWAKQAGGSLSDYGYNIAVDSSGNSYVLGYFCGTATFGTFTLTSYSESYDIFVCNLDTNGNCIWVNQAGGSSDDHGYGIAVDNASNSYLTGVFYNNATFGTTTLTSSGGWDIFVCKLDANGNNLWAKKAGGMSDDYGFDIAVDSAGNSYVTGYFQGSASFGATSLTSNGGYDMVITKLESQLTASFTADTTQGVEPLAVQFTDHSLPGLAPIINWFWTFGDGETSTLQHPTHTYLTPGIYTVSLTVLDASYQSSTLVRPDYITVIERVQTVDLLSDATLNFGSVYLEEQSAYQAVTFTNTGNVDLIVSEVHFISAPLHFEFSDPFRDLVLAPGETDSILVRFAPQAVGALSDTLYIANNSTNQPLLRIRLNGTGLYVPPNPPGNVSIAMNGYDAIITWDAVTQNIHGQPLTPDYYLVFYNGSSDPENGLYYFLSASNTLQYTHCLVGLHAQYMFYHVIAYKYYGRGAPDLSAWGLQPGMPEAEVMKLLAR